MEPYLQNGQPDADSRVPTPALTLHPNLARIAASYREICGRLERGQVDLTRAHVEIRELVARDDDGVQWTINPRDGGWMYLARTGQWTPGEPPRSGYATLTPHDLRAQAGDLPVGYNPDWELSATVVKEPQSNSLRGSTRRPQGQDQKAKGRQRWLLIIGAVVVVLALVALFLA